MGGAVAGVNVLRVSFSDNLETRWDVLVDPASPGFTLPTPPGTLRDRLFDNGNSTTGGRSSLVVQAFRMTKDPLVTTSAAIGFTEYVEFNDTNADRTTDFLTAFSFLSYSTPSISFKTPSANPATVTKGSKIVLKVGGFSVGTAASDDGVVKLSFGGATGCADVILNTEVPMKGSGEVESTLPMACVGTGISIKAELLKTDGATPIAPAIAKTITATIN
jgi:hypothetical protein